VGLWYVQYTSPRRGLAGTRRYLRAPGEAQKRRSSVSPPAHFRYLFFSIVPIARGQKGDGPGAACAASRMRCWWMFCIPSVT
jgi:hypothetical protein